MLLKQDWEALKLEPEDVIAYEHGRSCSALLID